MSRVHVGIKYTIPETGVVFSAGVDLKHDVWGGVRNGHERTYRSYVWGGSRSCLGCQ